MVCYPSFFHPDHICCFFWFSTDCFPANNLVCSQFIPPHITLRYFNIAMLSIADFVRWFPWNILSDFPCRHVNQRASHNQRGSHWYPTIFVYFSGLNRHFSLDKYMSWADDHLEKPPHRPMTSWSIPVAGGADWTNFAGGFPVKNHTWQLKIMVLPTNGYKWWMSSIYQYLNNWYLMDGNWLTNIIRITGAFMGILSPINGGFSIASGDRRVLTSGWCIPRSFFDNCYIP